MAPREALHSFVLCLAVCAVGIGGQKPRKPLQPLSSALPPVLSPQQIFERVAPSVMVVESLDAKGSVSTLGSGVVIAPGRVVTNRHVIEDGASFRLEHDGKTWPARLIRVDPEHDLAELSVAGLNAPAVQVHDSSTLAIGEKVYAIGAPEGLELTISEGLISGLRDFDKDRVIQTSAAISPGSSGGGLFDAEARLVGITTFYLKEGQSLNFALPAEWTLALNRQPIEAAPAAGLTSPAFQALEWFLAALDADRAGNHDAAVRGYEQAVWLKPDLAAAWYALGADYNRLGHYNRAASAELQAVRLRPDLADAWVKLATSYGELGQWGRAALAEQEAVGLKPGDEVAWIGLGEFYDRLGQAEKGASAEQEAVRLKPDDANAWYFLGRAYLVAGEYSKAVSAEQEAIRLNPSNGGAWFELGTAYLKLGQPDKTIRSEQEAVRLDPDDADAWFNLGLAYKMVGKQSQVIRVYEKLKTIDSKAAEKFFRLAVLP
ncbi:MAG: trypsin-like peptidase domain-containing protein [Bryobacteraceae bacterium]